MVEYNREEEYTKPKSIRELLSLAVERERASFGFYKEMAKYFFQNEDVRELLNELKNAEAAHIKRIGKKLEDLG